LFRCHTFGIGPEVCTELVTGIAAVSGGRCVLLREGERLQTKVSVRNALDYISISLQALHCLASMVFPCMYPDNQIPNPDNQIPALGVSVGRDINKNTSRNNKLGIIINH